MLILIYYLIVLLLIAKQKSRPIRFLAFTYLVVIFCFSGDIVDRDNYNHLLLNIDNKIGMVEIGWETIIFLFYNLNLDIQALCIFIGITYLLILFIVTDKLSSGNNIPIACYMIGLFFLDVVQLRNTFSAVFILLSFYFLFLYDSKKSRFLSLSLIILSSLIHASNIIFTVFHFIVRYKLKRTVLFSICAVVVLTFAVFSLATYFSVLFHIEDKIARIASTEGYTSEHAFLMVSLSGIAIPLVSWFANKHIVLSDDNNKNLFETTLKLSVFVLTIIPLIQLASDFRRQIYIVYIIIASLLCRNLHKYTTKMIPFFLIMIALMYFTYSTFLGNRESVFYPIFENNILFNAMK